MKVIAAFIKMMRVGNLAFLAITQYLIYFCILMPLLGFYGLKPSLDLLQYSMLVLSTVLIAGAGYIINDYFDIKIDQINKPHKVMLETVIKRRWAMGTHITLSALGILLALALAIQIGSTRLATLQALTVGLLFFYSTDYKKQLLTGNIVIAVLAALSVATIGFYEPQLYRESLIEASAPAAWIIMRLLLFYTFFSFLITLIREMVKDIEDFKGDAQFGCRTAPIVWGIRRTKQIIYVLIALLVAVLVSVQAFAMQHNSSWLMVYFIVLVQLPMLLVGWQLYKANTSAQYHKVSARIKWVTLAGILSMLVYYVQFISQP